MRSHIVRWGSLAYIVITLVALIWLSISAVSARTFRETTLASQAALLGNTLLGATQNLDAVSAPGGGISGEDAARFLEDLGRGNTLTQENRKVLADVKSDLELLRKAFQGDVLIHGNQKDIAALFEYTAAALSVSAAKSSLQQGDSK